MQTQTLDQLFNHLQSGLMGHFENPVDPTQTTDSFYYLPTLQTKMLTNQIKYQQKILPLTSRPMVHQYANDYLDLNINLIDRKTASIINNQSIEQLAIDHPFNDNSYLAPQVSYENNQYWGILLNFSQDTTAETIEITEKWHLTINTYPHIITRKLTIPFKRGHHWNLNIDKPIIKNLFRFNNQKDGNMNWQELFKNIKNYQISDSPLTKNIYSSYCPPIICLSGQQHLFIYQQQDQNEVTLQEAIDLIPIHELRHFQNGLLASKLNHNEQRLLSQLIFTKYSKQPHQYLMLPSASNEYLQQVWPTIYRHP